MTAKHNRLDLAWLTISILLLWQLCYWFAGSDALSSPWTTALRFRFLLGTVSLWRAVVSTGTAFLYATVVAMVLGLVIGLVFGLYEWLAEVFDPILGALYSLPKITLYPIILLLFGLGLEAKVAFGALHGIFPIAILTMSGVRRVPAVHRKTAKVLGLGRVATVWYVLAPAAVPEILSGLRIGVSSTLLGTLIAELFVATSGVGVLLTTAMDNHDVPTIMALTALIFAAAALLNTILTRVERRIRHGR